jgi:hypothetical protein
MISGANDNGITCQILNQFGADTVWLKVSETEHISYQIYDNDTNDFHGDSDLSDKAQ